MIAAGYCSRYWSKARCREGSPRVSGRPCSKPGIYDPASGQLLAGSFMDYAMPRAADLPDIASALRPVPATSNPLGVKGVGEAGTTASLAAVMNAVADALPEAPDIDMPATPDRVWRAHQGLCPQWLIRHPRESGGPGQPGTLVAPGFPLSRE